MIFAIEAGEVDTPEDQAEYLNGVLMEVGLANRNGTPSETYYVISMTAFSSGEASLKPSIGGGIVGLGNNERISEQAKNIVQMAQPLLGETQPALNQDMPQSGRVNFYFLTKSGVRFYTCGLKEIHAKKHPFNEIFSSFSQIKNQADLYIDNLAKQRA